MSSSLADVRIGRVRLQVADLRRSLAFYREVIGFRFLEAGDGVARLGPRPPDAGSTDAAPVLLELVEKPGARPVPRTGSPSRCTGTDPGRSGRARDPWGIEVAVRPR